ncbi:MAG TPA: TonB-dependent receptor [Thermomicrobiales bacterium]|jgi:iron complex outermembrane receptor protein|nr:TonB-dependent receptor [Thermomicrobiales bacterium]
MKKSAFLTSAVPSIAATIVLGAGQVQADEQQIQYLPSVVVSATRSVEEIKSIPGSVTVIEREEIAKQARTSRSLAEILGKTVPGLAAPSLGNTNASQTMRGRSILVLVDGIPQTTVRNVSRDLVSIDPSAIERVEVIRGATAVYGGGAAGGVINIITRKTGDGAPVWDTDIGFKSSLSHLRGDALGGWLRQGVSGKSGKVDYTVRLGAEGMGGMFDADGDRIPSDPSQNSLSDTNQFDILGKIGVDIDETQRLTLMIDHFNAQQDTNFLSDPSVNSLPRGSVKARAIDGLVLDDQPETVNTNINLDYEHRNVLGSRLHTQAYYRNYLTRFFPFDGRAFASWNNVAQTYLESETVGGRLAVETPLDAMAEKDLTILWGADVNREVTAQPATVYDPTAFDASGERVFQKVSDRTFAPAVTHTTVGLFGQGEWSATDYLTLRAGLRHETIHAEHDAFTTLGQGNAIAASSTEYSDILYNAGAVVYLSDNVEVFGGWSQGFSLPDVGLLLRGAPAGFSLSSSALKPIKVDNYEVGTRGHWGGIETSFTVFYTESDLGASSNGFTATVVRAPERTYGVEAAVSSELSRQWSVGGTFTWTEGESDPTNDLSDNYRPLNDTRIPPMKLTSYVEYEPWRGWTTRLQMLYSGYRDRAVESGTAINGQKIDSYVTFDLISTVALESGTLWFGIENLFNEQYHTAFYDALPNGRNDSHLAAPGTILTIGYSMTW